jgi:hypothetical protein
VVDDELEVLAVVIAGYGRDGRPLREPAIPVE